MTQHELEQLKTLILKRISELRELFSHRSEPSDQYQQQSDDQSASLDINISAAVETQLTDSSKRELKLLNATLEWLESEDAGYCMNCDCEIPLARLKAVPASHLCVVCAEQKGN
ncbi:MAG: RNA polymerase-binding transcription factor DksA [Motiliproteus sp.]|jgi:RNA polymerase-binding transcription factor DksA